MVKVNKIDWNAYTLMWFLGLCLFHQLFKFSELVVFVVTCIKPICPCFLSVVGVGNSYSHKNIVENTSKTIKQFAEYWIRQCLLSLQFLRVHTKYKQLPEFVLFSIFMTSWLILSKRSLDVTLTGLWITFIQALVSYWPWLYYWKYLLYFSCICG